MVLFVCGGRGTEEEEKRGLDKFSRRMDKSADFLLLRQQRRSFLREMASSLVRIIAQFFYRGERLLI